MHEPIRFGTLAGPSSFGVGSISTTSAFAPRPFNSFIGKGNKNTRTRHPIPSSFVSSRERVSPLLPCENQEFSGPSSLLTRQRPSCISPSIAAGDQLGFRTHATLAGGERNGGR